MSDTLNAEFLEKLLEISRQMAETRVLEPLLKYAMQEALQLFQGEHGYLVLVKPDGTLDFRVKIDSHGNELNQPEAEISTTILYPVIRERKSRLIHDALKEPTLTNATSVFRLQVRSVMCTPLIVKDEVPGALYIENRSSSHIFLDNNLKTLEYFASQAAVAIQNAILNEELEARVAARTAELELALHQLEQSWMEAVEGNRVRTILLGNVAHDMRAPISMSISALTAINDGMYGELNDAQRRWIERTLQSLEHAFALTSDVFDLAKAEEKQLTLQRQTVELNSFLHDVYDTCEKLPRSQAVQFEMDVDMLLPELYIDPTRIKQVLLNLLTNAHKFTEKGTITLYARHLQDKNSVLIGVRDTGIGIPSDFMDKIFQRFQRGENTLNHAQRGTGLGLAISKELVEQHGGTIRFTSEEGKSSDFQVFLPVK